MNLAVLMDPAYVWGIDLIRDIQWIQGPRLNQFFRVISFLGEDIPYLLLLIWMWCCSSDPRRALRIAYPVFLSFYLNAWAKDFFAQPRPFEIGDVLRLSRADGYGLPSGHAQSTLVFWWLTARTFSTARLHAVAALIILAVAFSRVYLGVHFPTDILGGWILGGLIIWASIRFGGRIEAAVMRVEPRTRILGMGLFCGILAFLFPGPTSAASLAFAFGLTVGLNLTGLGWVEKPTPVRRFIVTLLGAVVIYVGLLLIFPQAGEEGYVAFRSLRYCLLALWVSGIAPRLIQKVRKSPES